MSLINVVDAIIVNREKKILLQLRDRNKAIAGAGKWGLVGGKVKSGELQSTALKREVSEELGLTFDEYKLIDEVVDSFNGTTYNHGIYFIRYDKGNLHLGEGSKYGFFSLNEIKYIDLTPWFRNVYSGSIKKLSNLSLI